MVLLAFWHSYAGVRTWCLTLCVRCPPPLGACSRVCTFGEFFVHCVLPLGACSPVCVLGVLCCVSAVLGHLTIVHRCVCLLCWAVCEVSSATLCLFTGVRVWCVVCAVSLATWGLFTGVHAW